MDRPTVHPPRIPSALKLACLMFALACSLIVAASQLAQCTQAQGVQVPDPHMLTEHDLWGRVVNDLTEIGRRIPPNTPVEQLAIRRLYAADKLCDLAVFLRMNDPESFAGVVEAACAGLWEQWPERAQYCPACSR